MKTLSPYKLFFFTIFLVLSQIAYAEQSPMEILQLLETASKEKNLQAFESFTAGCKSKSIAETKVTLKDYYGRESKFEKDPPTLQEGVMKVILWSRFPNKREVTKTVTNSQGNKVWLRVLNSYDVPKPEKIEIDYYFMKEGDVWKLGYSNFASSTKLKGWPIGLENFDTFCDKFEVSKKCPMDAKASDETQCEIIIKNK